MAPERTRTSDEIEAAALRGARSNGAVNGSVPGGLVAQLGRAVAQQVQARIPRADLDERDPDYIRETLPGMWLLASFYFRADVKGLENIPAEGPVLLVGNHSGGNMTPDTLVFPGGDYEVHRPTWDSARVDFGGRKGYIRLALEKDVPIVPVVSLGGQETALFLSRGERLARLFRLDKLLRLKVLPISIAIPWGLNIGDMLGHWPLPAKLQMRALPAIDIRERFGRNPDIDEVNEHVLGAMQATLDSLAEERRFPLIG